MKLKFKKMMLAASCVAALGGINTTAQAADWLSIQGGERDGQAARARVWGFIQASYQKDNSDANGANQYIPPKLIGPDLDTQSAFNINRARIGVRGTGMPLDSNVNYFFLVEFGNNAITNPGDSFAYITDASITLNHLKEAVRVRVGQFKIPMADEIYQGIALFDYVNFTEGTNQLLLERIPNRTFGTTGRVGPQTLPVQNSLNRFTRPVAAARGVGIQFFNTLKVAPGWEVGYSAMVENGNGINSSDNDNNKDLNLYFNVTKIFKGVGPRRQDWKTFAWMLDGKRSFDGNNDGVVEEYDRKRYGVGTRYYKLPFRVTAEWIKAEGMIFVGPQNPDFSIAPPGSGNPAHPANGLNGKATSWYVETGYYIPGTRWELDARYAVLNRLEDSAFEFEFKNLTLGVQYHFNKKTRLAINLENRDYKAINFGSGAGPNANLDSVDRRLALQVTHIF